jgi:hypothetical protein
MLRLIFWIIVGLLALSFFGVSLRGLVNSPTNQDNLSFLSHLLREGWASMSLWLHAIIDPIMHAIHMPF